MGLQRAGFDVVGVDIAKQPRHRGGDFVQADALAYPTDGFDLVWASPPCQAYSCCRNHFKGKTWPSLIGPVRDRLIASGKPFIIENVPGAPLRDVVKLCGLHFGLKVIRWRWFETNMMIFSLPRRKTRGLLQTRQYYCVAGTSGGDHFYPGRSKWRSAMGIDWMTCDELRGAIPPAYAEYLGRQALNSICSCFGRKSNANISSSCP